MIAEAYDDAVAMAGKHRAVLDRRAGGRLAGAELDRLEIAAALRATERRPHAAPPGARPPLVPPPAGSRAPSPASRRAVHRGPVPALRAALIALVGRGTQDRRAPIA